MSDRDLNAETNSTDADVSRRDFLRRSSLTAGAAASMVGLGSEGLLAADDAKKKDEETPKIPTRTLGRTGEKVSILGLGSALMGHQNNNRPKLGPVVDVFAEAIDRGVTYVDTGRIYGRAEEALAKVLATRRKKVFLATKVWANTAEEAQKSFEESLKTMKVDDVDVLHIHHAGGKDIDQVLGKGGAWEYLQKMKKEGKTRFIGITGHARPANFVRMLETGTVDVMMVAMNFVDRHIYGFEEKVLPVARKHKTGVMAMKVYGGVTGGFKNYGKRRPHPSQMDKKLHESSIRYLKSLDGVTGMVIGCHNRVQLLENIRRVAEAKPLEKKDFEALVQSGKQFAPVWTPRFGPVS
ncbi:MAG: aldo/keto reductase [Planctomycetota bacterium]